MGACRGNPPTPFPCSMHSAVQQQQGFFLRDAFAQLDAVLAKKREVCETGGQSDAELKRAQQVRRTNAN